MRSARIAVAVAIMAIAPASASVVQPLDEDALRAGADRVVVARVLDVSGRWTADHRNLETVVRVLTDDGATLTIVQPGGAVGGARQVIVGMPRFRVGERSRYYLRQRPDGAWRVYGWSQGKWDEAIVDGAPGFVPGDRPDARAFEVNGMVWPAARMPVPYLINRAGSDDLAATDVADAIHAAFATWEDVPCAALTFRDAGPTDLGVAVDGDNAILFIEDGWIYGEEAAGATALTIIDGAQSADVAMNGQHFRWAIGPAGALAAGGTLDLQAVLTHELGHFSGLSHSQRSHDTMYYSWTPWPNQRTLSLDDKLGLCSIYPIAGDECDTSGAGCVAPATCTSTPAGRLCDTAIEPVGASCNYDHAECDAFCLYTSADLSRGYCSRFCAGDGDCPPTHHCASASAGGNPVRVCFAGAPPAGPDAGGVCTADDDCPTGQHCPTSGICDLTCRADTDCGGTMTCDDRGRCVGADAGGCGCTSGGDPAAGAGLLALALAWRRRRRR